MRSAVFGAAVVAAACGAAVGQTQVFNTQAGFLAVLSPGFYFEDFAAIPTGAVQTLNFGPVNGFSYTASAEPGGLFNAPGILSTNNAVDPLVITFTGNQVFAVGGNFWAADINFNSIIADITITLSDGTVESFQSTGPADFRGFAATSPIVSMTIDAADIPVNAWPSVQNLYVGVAGDIPLSVSYITAPGVVNAGMATIVDVTINPGDDTFVNGSAKLFSRPNSAASFTSTPLTLVSGTTWTGSLPAFGCSDDPEYFAEAAGVTTGTVQAATVSPIVTTGTQMATFLDADFESGLPAGGSVSGLWHLTTSCAPSASCAGPTTAYFGNDATCTFDTGFQETGSLSMPLDLSTAGTGSTITLEYCYARSDEGGIPFDFAEVRFNGSPVDTNPPQSAAFTTRSVDMSAFAGQSGTLEFFYDTVDSIANTTLGWMVDGVSVTGSKLVCDDCYADCDGSGSLDFFDFLCFQNEFANGTAYADCDGSGGLDFFDFLCFQNAFANGCP